MHRSASGWWYEAGSRFLLAVPTHRPLTLADDEAREVLRATGALGLRYVSAAGGPGRPSWQMVATGADYDLENFSANTRSKIRRGLKQHQFRRVSGEELARVGERAFLDTVVRQGRAGRYGLDRWRAMLASADATAGIEIWSAWQDQVLAAYLLVMVFEDACEFYEARSRDETLRSYPNNALVYTVARQMLVERGLPQVTFGIAGLEENESLDAFKLAMGFIRKPILQHVVFHPALQLALSLPPIRGVVSLLARREHGAGFWRRAQGLVALSGMSG